MSNCVIATSEAFYWGNDGYPRLKCPRRGYPVTAVIVLWEHEHGPIPDGHQPDHKCKDITCINLEHIEIVTAAENNRRAHAKLTTTQVLAIRERLAAGDTSKYALARQYQVDFMTITHIERRVTWRDI
jgi:hypothetical protein